MKVVILAGGLGTRISEETHVKPKPMVEIGGKPIIWHIMKIYSHYGFNDFVVCLGYKGYSIKEWFSNYFLHNSDVTLDLETNSVTYHKNPSEKWRITLVDTGEKSMTGGRIKRIQEHVGDNTFMMTYGDGVSDIDINKLVDFHKEHKKLATVTAVIPEGKFGVLSIDDELVVTSFGEKTDNKSRVSGGFFVLEPEVFSFLENDQTIFEKDPLEKLATMGELKAFNHDGFWKPMDSLNDKNKLDELWCADMAPWKLWE